MSESKLGNEKIDLRELLLRPRGRIHFIGVLGISMSGIAEWCVNRGFVVSGSDEQYREGKRTPDGVRVKCEAEDEDIVGADLVVYSLAIPYNNKERKIARKNKIPEVSRAEMLGAIMQLYEIRIGVSGTHGKSTTSALIYHILKESGEEPTAFIGAKINAEKSYSIGSGKYFIYEACEYKDAFLQFSPTYAIITSVELDHTDYFACISSLRDSFARSTRGADRVYISTDVERYREIGERTDARVIYYGNECNSGYSYSVDSVSLSGSRFTVYRENERVGEFFIPIPGEYNIRNALAAIALLTDLGYGACQINRALSTFFGIAGRLEYVGESSAGRIYLDYAHHPTAVRETLRLMKSLFDEVSVVFRPHTYTRTRDFAREFADALAIADRTVITDIYPAREEPIPGVSAEWLAAMIPGAQYKPLDEVAKWVLSDTGGTIVLMGAGDLSMVKEMILDKQGENK